MTENALVIFENYKIRRHFDEQTETWYFSVVDVVGALTNSANPRDYWFKMKIRVKGEDGLELSTICRQLKMKAPDGKMRETDTANVEGLLRIIQSIPSPKAEPFKLWLAKVGYERLQDMSDPAAQTIHRLWWIKFVCPLWGPRNRPPLQFDNFFPMFNIISSIYRSGPGEIR